MSCMSESQWPVHDTNLNSPHIDQKAHILDSTGIYCVVRCSTQHISNIYHPFPFSDKHSTQMNAMLLLACATCILVTVCARNESSNHRHRLKSMLLVVQNSAVDNVTAMLATLHLHAPKAGVCFADRKEGAIIREQVVITLSLQRRNGVGKNDPTTGSCTCQLFP